MVFTAHPEKLPFSEVRPACGGWIRAVLTTALLAFAMVEAPAGAHASPRSAFMARHRCPVVAVLQEIHHRGPVETSRNRFVALAVRGALQRYVQCIFIERDTAMFCEASSGAYGAGDQSLDRFVPTEGTRDALHRLGFTQDDAKTNYSRMVRLGSPPDVRLAADLMLAALYDAYGAQPETDLEMTAPMGGNASGRCGAPPVAGGAPPNRHSAAST